MDTYSGFEVLDEYLAENHAIETIDAFLAQEMALMREYRAALAGERRAEIRRSYGGGWLPVLGANLPFGSTSGGFRHD